MAGDPKECRRRALWCADLAHDAKSSELKIMLVELSRNWLKMAIELERMNAFLDDESPLTNKPT